MRPDPSLEAHTLHAGLPLRNGAPIRPFRQSLWMKNSQTRLTQLASLLAVPVLAVLGACAAPASRSPAEAGPPTSALFETVYALDAAAFDAFNKCSAPEQLQKHASYFAPDVEFYHDTGGVTWTRQAMLANTEKYVCGNFRRELVPGSLGVFPVKDFGAIAQGVHRFCQFKTGECEGMADFVIVWRNQGGKWEITRVLSYGHRPGK
jgi:hypothetical protein